jgi:hypothetical protein
MATQYYAQGDPLPGIMATDPDGLPIIDSYEDSADLPTVYNELSQSTQAALVARLKQGDPSSGAATPGYRKITVSQAAPTGGSDGDVWLQW